MKGTCQFDRCYSGSVPSRCNSFEGLDRPLLWHENSSFAKYYSWFKSAQGTLLELSGDQVPLFPSALPYPEVFEAEWGGVSANLSRELWSKAYLNELVAWSNFLCLGSPDSGESAFEPRVGYRCMSEARAYADGLLGEVAEFATDELRCHKLTCTGKRQALEAEVAHLACTGAYGGLRASQLKSAATVALPVVADRIGIPAQAGSVDPSSLLPPEQAAVVDNLEQLKLPETLWREVVKACHKVAPLEEAGLMKRLLETNMVSLVPEEDIPRDNHGRLLIGGLFAVGKNENEDRLIFDRRLQNATMQKLTWAHLPAGACFSRMLLGDNEYVRGSGDDLRNYYYALRLPENWVRHNAVGRRVAPELVKQFGGDINKPYRACFRVLGMGDVNACDIAQAVHEAVLRREGLLVPDTTLVYGHPVPDGPLWEGIYLDDLLVTYKMSAPHPIPLDGSFRPPPAQDKDPDMLRVAAAEKAYRDVGLPRAEHKSFRAEADFKAWGAEVRGVIGTVGAPLQVRQQLWQLLRRVAHGGFCTLLTLQKLMGFACFIFQYRRECFSLQHHIYKYMDSMHATKPCWLPHFIRDELMSMAIHLPFCKWNMRKKFSQEILATDATPISGGAVMAPAPEALLRALWRQAETRGECVRLDRTAMDEMLVSEKAPKEPSVFASAVSECLPWRVTASYSFRQTSHINLQEARALKREVVKLASSPSNINTIQLCLNDSRVCVGAFAKGRSSSFKLNGILRSMLPFLIFSGVTLGLLWVETASNIADYPSRFVVLPPPAPVPRWLELLGVAAAPRAGIEIFAGTARLTAAFRRVGVEMHEPVEIDMGRDAFDSSIDALLLAGLVAFVWLSPPCGSLSPLRNLDYGGPLRPKGCPEGDPTNPEIRLGNALWMRALQLAWMALERGIPVCLEHPLGSKAWLLDENQPLLSHPLMKCFTVHWCAYDDDRTGLPTKKPTRLLSSYGWLAPVVRQCPGCMVHGPPLRGPRAKRAGAYPLGFCAELAEAYVVWRDGAVGDGRPQPQLPA